MCWIGLIQALQNAEQVLAGGGWVYFGFDPRKLPCAVLIAYEQNGELLKSKAEGWDAG